MGTFGTKEQSRAGDWRGCFKLGAGTYKGNCAQVYSARGTSKYYNSNRIRGSRV